MKKIFFAILALFAMVACIKEDLPQLQQVAEGDLVTLTFGVQVPEAGSVATRSMASPTISRLDVLVFDHEGYFVEKAAATALNDSATPTDPTARKQFTVTLTKTANARSIHFIANCADAANANFGHEDALVSNLAVGDDQDAYWQRMEFINGIASDSGTNFNNSTLIPLVRNFARVSVSENLSNFELTGFAVVNTMTEGSVAAYAQNKGEFVEYTQPSGDTFVAKTYQELISTVGYTGFEAGELNSEIAFTTSDYAYVRETTAANNPCIIVRGKYNGGEETFYKLDFMLKRTEEGAALEAPILRNFSYEFKITSVTKAGYNSAEDALAGNSENNMSADPMVESLLNISDGEAQLFVNATSVTLVSGDAYYLMYKYVPQISTGTTSNGSANIALDETDVTTSIFSEVGTTGTVRSLYDATTDAELKAYYEEYLDYNYVVLDPIDPQNNILSQNVIVSAGNLSRVVKFDLRQKINMTVVVYDGSGSDTSDKEVPRATNQKVNVAITIPGGLSQSIFPLEFDIESSALSLYPDTSVSNNNMPVRTGQSIIEGSTATTFGFVKTYTWAEYVAAGGENNPVTITTYFRTNKEASASTVYVGNKFFNQASDAFTNGGDPITYVEQEITVSFSDQASYYGAGRTVTATINVPNAADADVTVTVGDGFAQPGTSTMKTNGSGNITLNLTTAGWSGNRSVTVSYDAEIVSGNQVITYTDGSATATVNTLYIPADSFITNTENINSRTVYIGLSSTSNGTEQIRFDSDGTNRETEATISGLTETSTLYLRYQTGIVNRQTYIATTTASAAASTDDDNITFNRQ